MQKNPDLIKLSIWVTSGVLLGAIITLGAEQFILPPAHNGGSSKQASAKSDNNTDPDAANSADASSESANASATGESNSSTPTSHPSSKYESPYPASSALAILNSGTGTPITQAPNTVQMQPNMSYTQSVSGYPVCEGGRAIDSPPAQIPAPAQAAIQIQQLPDGQLVQVIPAESQTQLAPQAVGRNGLLANPCADPYSAHGLAYSRRHYN